MDPLPRRSNDSSRQIVPRACLVPVLATSAGQVVRRVLAWAERVPGRRPTPSQLGPEGSLWQRPLGREWRFHAAVPRRQALLCPSWARDGSGLQAPTSPHPAGPTLAHPSLPRAGRAATVLDLTVGGSATERFRASSLPTWASVLSSDIGVVAVPAATVRVN